MAQAGGLYSDQSDRCISCGERTASGIAAPRIVRLLKGTKLRLMYEQPFLLSPRYAGELRLARGRERLTL